METKEKIKETKTGCPKCGSTKGFESRITGIQYYTCNGEPDGYEIDVFSETRTIRCINCGYRTTVAKLASRSGVNE